MDCILHVGKIVRDSSARACNFLLTTDLLMLIILVEIIIIWVIVI